MRKFILAATLMFPLAAVAHTAPAGWEYDAECCSSEDCAQVSDALVEVIPEGFRIILLPGSHPMFPANRPAYTEVIRRDDPRIRPSGDDKKHVCVARYSNYIYCIYIPVGGV